MSGFGLMIDATSKAIPGLLSALGSNNPQTFATYDTGTPDIDATPAQLSELAARAGLFVYDQSAALQKFAAGIADAADIELGAGTIVAAVAAATHREAVGWHSWFYLSESNLADARSAASGGHLTRVRFIVANWSFNQAEAEQFLVSNPDVDGVQWASPSSNPNTICPGTTRTLAQLNVDLNLVRAGWFTKQAATNPPIITKGLVVKNDLTTVAVTSTDGKTWASLGEQMSKRILAIVIVIIAGLGIGIPVALANGPGVEIATNQGSSSQCMNRQGGGTTSGTHVIGWSCGDQNNDFEYAWLNLDCQDGYVKSTQHGDSENCPFANTALDALNWKYAIVEIEAFNESGLCVGNPSSAGGGSVLTGCPDNTGQGGGWATIDVLVGISDFPGYDGHAINVQNKHWSDNYNQDRWICSNGHGQQWTLAGQNGLSGACQLAQITP